MAGSARIAFSRQPPECIACPFQFRDFRVQRRRSLTRHLSGSRSVIAFVEIQQLPCFFKREASRLGLLYESQPPHVLRTKGGKNESLIQFTGKCRRIRLYSCQVRPTTTTSSVVRTKSPSP